MAHQQTNLCSSLTSHVTPDVLEETLVLLRKALGFPDPISDAYDDYIIVRDYDSSRHLFSMHFTSHAHLTELYQKTCEKMEGDTEILVSYRVTMAHLIATVRGVVVYAHQGDCKVVSRGFPHTPICTVTGNLNAVKGVVTLVDNHGVQRSFSPKESHFVPRMEGAVLRVSYLDGEVMVTTNRKLNVDRSRWGGSDLFLNMYKNFGGPDMETLFQPGIKDSRFVRMFMLVEPNLQIAARYPIGEGYIVYLGSVPTGTETGEDEEDVDFSRDFVVMKPGEIPITSPSGGDGTYPTGTVFRVGAMSFDQANRVVSSGYGKHYDFGSTMPDGSHDFRVTSGEAVVCHYTDTTTGTNGILHINSLAYNWRTSLVNNNHNSWFQFVQYYTHVLDGMKKRINPTHPENTSLIEVFDGVQDKFYSYDQLFPNVCSPDDSQIMKLAARTDEILNTEKRADVMYDEIVTAISNVVTLRSSNTPGRDPREQKFSNIAMCCCLGFPIVSIGDVVHFFPNFIERRESTITMLTANKRFDVFYRASVERNLYKISEAFGTPESPSRAASIVSRIIIQAHKYAPIRRAKGEMSRAVGSNGRRYRLGIEFLQKDNVRNLVMKEAGNSLYTMMTSMANVNVSHVTNAVISAPYVQQLPQAGDFPSLSMPELGGLAVSPSRGPTSFPGVWSHGPSPTVEESKDDDDLLL
jgi:hypothetical protein